MRSAESDGEEGDVTAVRLSDAVDFSGAASMAGDRLRDIPKNRKMNLGVW